MRTLRLSISSGHLASVVVDPPTEALAASLLQQGGRRFVPGLSLLPQVSPPTQRRSEPLPQIAAHDPTVTGGVAATSVPSAAPPTWANAQNPQVSVLVPNYTVVTPSSHTGALVSEP